MYMPPLPQRILLTGPPRCGKSTLIKRIIQLVRRPMVGFLTEEIRHGRERTGFSISTLGGRQGILASRDLRSQFRVGKYRVSLEDMEGVAVPAMAPTRPDQLVVVDEIGKMECLSPLFRVALLGILDSGHALLASISEKGDDFIQGIKRRHDIKVVHVSHENREALVVELSSLLDG
jgi:nucleoside-triphosphatase